MRRACIVHGWNGSPDEPLLAWLKASLEERGFAVVTPSMPDPAVPEIGAWVDTLREAAPVVDGETVFIGHSIGCQAVLRYLETLPADSRIGELVLIAPWMALDEETIREEGPEVREIARPWMETPIDFAKVRGIARRVSAIFSDDDPYVPLAQKDIFAEALGATVVVEHALGHFTISDSVERLDSALAAALGN